MSISCVTETTKILLILEYKLHIKIDNCALSGRLGKEPKSSRYSIIFEIIHLLFKSSLDRNGPSSRASTIRLATFSQVQVQK